MGSPSRFEDIPQRIFLDSSCLQTLGDYGGYVFENEPPSPVDRIHAVPAGLEKLEALRLIFQLVNRGSFEFALSENSLREVVAKQDAAYLAWAYDVIDHWKACVEASGLPADAAARAAQINEPRFSYLSHADRLLLCDAVAFGCDTFLTMERRLPRNREHLERELGIRVLDPIACWELLEPWAALYA